MAFLTRSLMMLISGLVCPAARWEAVIQQREGRNETSASYCAQVLHIHGLIHSPQQPRGGQWYSHSTGKKTEAQRS